jgi:cytochrome c553
VSDFRHAIFLFESEGVPEELRVIDGVVAAFAERPEATKTLAMHSRGIDDAALQLDNFKARTCGSPVTLAIINLNMFPSVKELQFLMQLDVLGDPRTIFLASLKYMSGEIYTFAREKVARESEVIDRTPSCIDCYGAPNRDNVYPRVAELSSAYLIEAETREEKLRNRGDVALEPAAVQLLRKSETTFFGKNGNSGRFRPVDTHTASGVRKSIP